MVELYTEIVGYIATFFSCIVLLPQLIKIITTNSSKDISFIFLLFNLLSSLSWFIYGILLESIPIIVCDTIMTIFTLLIMGHWIIFNAKSSCQTNINIINKCLQKNKQVDTNIIYEANEDNDEVITT